MPLVPSPDWIGGPEGLQREAIGNALHELIAAAISGVLPQGQVWPMSEDLPTTLAQARALQLRASRRCRWADDVQREQCELLLLLCAALRGDPAAIEVVLHLLRRRAERLGCIANEIESTAIRLRLRLAESAWNEFGAESEVTFKGSQEDQANATMAGAGTAVSPEETRVSVCLDIPMSGDTQTDLKLREFRILQRGVRLLPAPSADTFVTRLAEEMPQAAAVARWLGDVLTLRRYTGQTAFHLPPLLLHGPPGCGKSHLARRLFELAGIPHRLLSVAASSDARLLLGTARGWSTGQASFPAQCMAGLDAANPGLCLDEIDKADEDSRNGSVTRAVLSHLEPITARGTLDEFLMTEIDTSRITWILTANDISRLSAPLRSRLMCFEIAPPTEDVLPAVIGQLLAGIARDLDTSVAMLPEIAPERLELAQRDYRRHHCLRRLKAFLHALLVHGVRSRVLH